MQAERESKLQETINNTVQILIKTGRTTERPSTSTTTNTTTKTTTTRTATTKTAKPTTTTSAPTRTRRSSEGRPPTRQIKPVLRNPTLNQIVVPRGSRVVISNNQIIVEPGIIENEPYFKQSL